MTIFFVGQFDQKFLPKQSNIISIEEAHLLPAKLTDGLKHAKILVTRSGFQYTQQILQKAPKLKLIIKAGSGTDMIDHKYCISRNIIIRNTPGMNSQSVAELTIGLLLAVLRQIPLMDSTLRDHGKSLKEMTRGAELWGKKVTIIGFGYVGRRTARLLSAFNCSITIYDPTLKTEEIDAALLQGYILTNVLNEAFNTDILIFHPSSSITSYNLLNSKNIHLLRKGIVIVNMARAAVIEKAAILKGLQKKIIRGIGIDTWWSQPWNDQEFSCFPNVVMTPHIGANTTEAVERVTKKAIEVIHEFSRSKI